MRKPTLLMGITMACVLLAATAPAEAQQVYRWVDENGVVHFGDLPPEGVEATPVSVRPNAVQSVSPGNPAKPAGPAPGETAEPGAGGETGGEPELSLAEQRRKERSERREENARQARELEQQCDAMRKQKNWLEPSPRVLVRAEDGSTRRLDDAERERVLAEANAFLQANCQ
jgi:hypothetical protein